MKRFFASVAGGALASFALAQSQTGTDFSAVRTALNNEWATGVGVVLGIFGLALGINFVMRRLRAAAK